MPGFIGDYYFNYHYHHYWLDDASCPVLLVNQEQVVNPNNNILSIAQNRYMIWSLGEQ